LRGDLRQVIQLGCLVHDVAGGRHAPWWRKAATLKKRGGMSTPLYTGSPAPKTGQVNATTRRPFSARSPAGRTHMGVTPGDSLRFDD